MPGMLQGKVAVVTGAAQGIGLGYAETLSREGAAVALVDLKGELATERARAIEAAGGRAIAVSADVSDAPDVERMLRETAEAFGGIDILVNNAALYEGYTHHPPEDIPLDYWNHFLDINATSILITTQAVVPYMRERGYGRIVNQSSDSADLCINQYGISKLLLQGLTVGFARELGQYGITVNVLAPGPTATAATLDKYGAETFLDAMIIKRLGTPRDHAEFLAFLVSDKADWITGQIFHVNGGFFTKPG